MRCGAALSALGLLAPRLRQRPACRRERLTLPNPLAPAQNGNYVEYRRDEVEDAWADELASEWWWCGGGGVQGERWGWVVREQAATPPGRPAWLHFRACQNAEAPIKPAQQAGI